MVDESPEGCLEPLLPKLLPTEDASVLTSGGIGGTVPLGAGGNGTKLPPPCPEVLTSHTVDLRAATS